MVDDSVIEIDVSPKQTTLSNSNATVTGLTTTSNLILHLSSSSSNSPQSPVKSSFNNITLRKSSAKIKQRQPPAKSLKSRRMSITSGKLVSVTKTNKKRVSVCGDGLSDDVLQIDETILDEYENELDLKKGKLFVIDESNIELDTNASYNNYGQVADHLSIINETDNSETDESSNHESTKRGKPMKQILVINSFFFCLQTN